MKTVEEVLPPYQKTSVETQQSVGWVKSNETQQQLVISYWSLVISDLLRFTKDKGVPEPVEGQKRRLGEIK